MKTLSGRYIAIFLMILVLPVFFARILLDGRYYNKLKDAALTNNQKLTEQMGISLDEEILQIQILSAGLINDLDFLDSSERYVSAGSSDREHLANRELEAHLNTFFRYINKIGEIHLFFENKPRISYQNYPVTGSLGLEDLSYLEPAKKYPGVNYVVPGLFGVTSKDVGNPLLSIAVSPSSTNTRNGLEVMLLSFKLHCFPSTHFGQHTNFS